MVDQSKDWLRIENGELRDRVHVPHLSIEQGECVVLCGPNGSGKSSLLRLLAGLEPEFTGHVYLGGKNLKTLTRRDIAAQIAWVPQRPLLSDHVTCDAMVAAARFRFAESPRAALAIARRRMSERGLEHLVGHSAQQVSGGELQRVLLTCLIAQESPVLLVDEPANHLDPRHQISAYSDLGKLWLDEGRTLVVVTHDVRLISLLGPKERIRVVGVLAGKLAAETTFATPELTSTLAALYGVSFVDPDAPGGLSVDLSPSICTAREDGEKPR